MSSAPGCLKATIKVPVLQSSKDHLGKVLSPSSITWILALLKSLWASILTGHGLKAAFLVTFHVNFCIRHLMTWQLALSEKASNKSQRKRKDKQNGSHGLYDIISKVTSHHFCYILCKWVIRFNPYSKGRDYIRETIPEGRVTRSHCRSSLPPCHYTPSDPRWFSSFHMKSIFILSEVSIKLTYCSTRSMSSINSANSCSCVDESPWV